MRSRRHTGFSLVLALIVLIAQLGAQAHAYSHLAKAPDSVPRHGQPAPCAECSAFAPLLTAVSGVSCPVVAAAVEPPTLAVSIAAGAHRAANCQAYRSRAPPRQS